MHNHWFSLNVVLKAYRHIVARAEKKEHVSFSTFISSVQKQLLHG